MLIFGKTKVDKYYRIILTDLFKGKTPSKVCLTVDSTKKKAIRVIPVDESCFLPYSQVDEKNRICLPKWIREEFAEIPKEFFLAVCDDELYLVPKTENIL